MTRWQGGVGKRLLCHPVALGFKRMKNTAVVPDKYRWLDMNNPYRYRDENLKAMGFKSYSEYLRSDLWASIRKRALEMDDKCQRCGKTATQVHHRAYDPATLRGDNINSLSPLCGRCHRKAESQPRENREKSYMKLRKANIFVMKAARKAEKRRRSKTKRALGMADAPKLVRPTT